MNAIARMAVLDMRSAVPYRNQALLLFGVVVLVLADNPDRLVPAFVLLVTSQIVSYPFNAADKAGLETLYAVLPVPRRTVLYGHYAWAMANFLATIAMGTALTFILTRIEAIPFSGRTLVMMLTLSWALFVVNVAIQFPLFIRFGYSRISVLGTVLPLGLVMGGIVRLHLTVVPVAAIQRWLPLIWVAGVAALVASVGVAMTVDRSRLSRSRL